MTTEPNDRAYEIRSVDRMLAVLNHGDDCEDATRDYRQLVAALKEHVERYGGNTKGKMILTFDFVADARGVDVAMNVTTKIPARPRIKDRYFISECGETLTGKDPGKETLFPGADMGRKRPAAI